MFMILFKTFSIMNIINKKNPTVVECGSNYLHVGNASLPSQLFTLALQK